MEVNFSDSTPSTPAVDVAATTTPVPGPVGPVGPVGDPGHPGTPGPAAGPAPSQLPATTGPLLGDRLPEFKDIILPRLNLVQNLGKLTEGFESGSLVYNQQVPLFIPGKVNAKTSTLERPATPPVIMTVMGFKSLRYYEKVKWGGDTQGERGVIVDSEAAVRAAGGTLDYNEWKLKSKDGMKRFEPGIDALFAIVRPEICKDNESDFTFEVEGQFITLAMWNMRGSIYTAAVKRVFDTAKLIGCLKQGYPTWSFAVSTREEDWSGGVKSWIPVCVPNKRNTPAFMDFVRSIIG